ncbi:MAG: heavy-metal-associated domain-containing protein [Lachnospiraceae bacterium]|nr:heavy-metal-associated domain-containing protein [Lachnospiraceae bacterium]
MEDLIIVIVLAAMILIGIVSGRKHFKGQGGCCGGGSTYVSKKKLNHVTGKKTAVIEGMTCENCKARVERAINDIDGAAGRVNLRKKEAVISMEREISDEEIRSVIERAGYEVVEIR